MDLEKKLQMLKALKSSKEYENVSKNLGGGYLIKFNFTEE